MYCDRCGTLLPEGSRFCPKCGADLFAAEIDSETRDMYDSGAGDASGSAYREGDQAFGEDPYGEDTYGAGPGGDPNGGQPYGTGFRSEEQYGEFSAPGSLNFRSKNGSNPDSIQCH